MAIPEQTSNRKPRLGRGLSSLIVNSSQPEKNDTTYVSVSQPHPEAPQSDLQKSRDNRSSELPIEHIAPNPYQPRRHFSEEQLTELAESIVKQGIIQPLVVCRSPGEAETEKPYTLIAGERRLRAARQAHLDTVPCVVRNVTPQQMLEWALIENIQRTDLNPIERAQAYREYIDRFNLTQSDAGERLGQSRANIANYLRLLELESEVCNYLLEGLLTFGHAKVLASLLADRDAQLTAARKVVSENLSVRQTETLIAAMQNSRAQDQPTRRTASPKAPYLMNLENRLSETVGTRVTILPGRNKHTGRIVVQYYSLDDFDRISIALGLSSEQ